MQQQHPRAGLAPVARFKDLAVTKASDEVLVYDTVKHHIHKLNTATAAIWRLCDGSHNVSDIGRLATLKLGAPVDDDMVRLVLTKLDDAGLLANGLAAELRMSRMTRRGFMQRSAVAGAVAVPAIVSITSPTSAGVNLSPACATCTEPGENTTECLAECPFCTGVEGQMTCNPDVPVEICGNIECDSQGDWQGFLGTRFGY